jgi:hypothetical protein
MAKKMSTKVIGPANSSRRSSKGEGFALPMRQVHLDFHTSEFIPDVGRDFDANEFAATFKRAHVNSVTVFAKCHHGHLYYKTNRAERHPGLKPGLDLLGEQVKALHAAGIRAPIYISIQCDEYAANRHPEWLATKSDGAIVKSSGSVFKPGWQILDMSSPYLEYLVEQTTEVLRKFKPVDGIFFDMCWDQPSCSHWAIAGMQKAKLDPESETDRNKYAHQVSLGYMRRLFELVKSHSKDATVYFNSRLLSEFADDLPYQTQVEIEALASGGWGYMYFPRHVRYMRTFPRLYLGMTARFHKSWADFGGLKNYAALEYETSQMIAHAAACSIGDQLHPRGRPDPAAYELIGQAYQRIADREPWLVGAKPVTEIAAVIQPNAQEDDRSTWTKEAGITRMLSQLKHQFDFVSESSNWDQYDMLVLEDISLTDTLAAKIRRHLKRGKSLLVTGTTGLSLDAKKFLISEIPAEPHGLSPYTTTYLRFDKSVPGIPDSDHVMYDRSIRVTESKGAKVIARVVEPYFERTWEHFSSHFQTPPAKVSRYAGAVVKNRVGYVAYPIFASYATHANLPCRWLVSALLEKLLPEPLVRVNAPSSTEVTVTRQDGRTIVHLLQYCPERRGKDLDLIEDVVPLFNVELSLRLARKPSGVYRLTPQPEQLEFDYRGGRVNIVIPEVRGHEMIVLDSPV